MKKLIMKYESYSQKYSSSFFMWTLCETDAREPLKIHPFVLLLEQTTQLACQKTLWNPQACNK